MARESGDMSPNLSFKAIPCSYLLEDIHSGNQLATITMTPQALPTKRHLEGLPGNCVSVAIKCYHKLALREAAWRRA